jgi:ferredoxin-NADP reductase
MNNKFELFGMICSGTVFAPLPSMIELPRRDATPENFLIFHSCRRGEKKNGKHKVELQPLKD